MVTNAKVTVDEIKKSAASAASTVKAVTPSVTTAAKKAAGEVKKEATAAKKTATKKATAAKKTVKKATAKAKKEVATTAVVQYQDREFTEAECLKKAQAQFKKDYKGKTLEELNIYIKPEERKIYYVANKDCVGSVDL